MLVQRVFAHRIIYCGKEYRNHVAELASDGTVVLFPFEREIAMTTFYSGTIELTVTSEPRFEIRQIC